jgi:hypothetical protein
MTTSPMRLELIAPCGMNCALCMAWQREKDRCPGCRDDDAEKSKSRATCVIKNCDRLEQSGLKYCSSRCEKYPCKRLRDLDKRYRTKYRMSMIENLESIEAVGIRAFVRAEKERWACPDCGGVICVHKACCSVCGLELSG